MAEHEGMGGGYDDEVADGGFRDEEKAMPHGAHAVHDMHDYYTAGMDTAASHLELADNPALKEILEDHADQMAAMAHELRAFFEEHYPDHEPPEEPGGETVEEEMEDGDGELEEKALERTTPESVGNPERVRRERGGDRVEGEERKSRTRRGLDEEEEERTEKRGRHTRKSYAAPHEKSLLNTRRRKAEQLCDVYGMDDDAKDALMGLIN